VSFFRVGLIKLKADQSLATIQSQLKTVPPYIVAAVWAILVSYTGLRLRTRSLAVLLGMPLVVIGYAINLATDNANARCEYIPAVCLRSL
jgi:hypothetical protein